MLSFQVGFDHDLNELFKFCFRLPAQALFCLGGIRVQKIHLRGPNEIGIDPHEIIRIEIQMAKRNVCLDAAPGLINLARQIALFNVALDRLAADEPINEVIEVTLIAENKVTVERYSLSGV